VIKHTEDVTDMQRYTVGAGLFGMKRRTWKEIERKCDKLRDTDMSVHNLQKNKTSQCLHERSKNPVLRIKRLPEI
jgi:hypothetical protein